MLTDPHEIALAYLAKRPTGWHALAQHLGIIRVFNVSPVQLLRDLVAMGYATEAEGLTTITPEGLAEVERSKPAAPARPWLPIVISAEAPGLSASFELRDEPSPHVRVATPKPTFGDRARGWLPLLAAMRAGQAVPCPECKREPVTVVLVPVRGTLGDLRFSCSSCGAGGEVRGGPA